MAGFLNSLYGEIDDAVHTKFDDRTLFLDCLGRCAGKRCGCEWILFQSSRESVDTQNTKTMPERSEGNAQNLGRGGFGVR